MTIYLNRRNVSKCSLFITFLMMLMCSNLSMSLEESSKETVKQLSIDGYSPVSYFTENRAEKGSPEFAVEYGDWIYYLTSAEQVELFNQNPAKYKPKYHYCAYSVVLGKKLPLDPTNFKVVGDSVLLFHKTESTNGLDLWDTDIRTDEELIELADRNYTLLEF